MRTDPEGRKIVLIAYMRAGNIWMPRKVYVSHPEYPGFFGSYDFRWSKCRNRLYYQGGDNGPMRLAGYPEASRVKVKIWLHKQADEYLAETEETLQRRHIQRISEPLPLGRREIRNPLRYGRLSYAPCCRYCAAQPPKP